MAPRRRGRGRSPFAARAPPCRPARAAARGPGRADPAAARRAQRAGDGAAGRGQHARRGVRGLARLGTRWPASRSSSRSSCSCRPCRRAAWAAASPPRWRARSAAGRREGGRRAGRPRARHRARHGRALHRGALAGGPALYRAMGGTARRLEPRSPTRSVLFGGAARLLALQHARRVIRGTGNMALPAAVMVASGASTWRSPPRSSWAGAPAPPRRRGRGRGQRHLLRARQRRLLASTCLRPEPRRLSLARPAPAVAALPGDPARGRTRLAQHRLHEPDVVLAHRRWSGPFGAARAGRLRHGRAARIPADPDRVRSGLGARHHGRHQHGRGQPGAGPARGVGRRGDGGRASPARSGSSAALFPHVWLGLFTRDPEVLAAGDALSAHRRALLRLLRRSASRCTSPRRGRAGCCGRSSPRFVRLAIAAAGGWLATRWLGTGLSGLFAAMAAALVAMGIINVAAVHFGAWRRRP